MESKLPNSISTIKHITILYNRVTKLSFGKDKDILADEDTVKTAQHIYQVLKKEGFSVSLFEINEKSISKLFQIKTDFFFNLCGGIGNIPNSEHQVPQILDKIGIPYNGANRESLLLTTDKVQTKKFFKKFHIPTPLYQVFITGGEQLKKKLTFPLMVKPSSQDCSLGITNESIVEDRQSLKGKVQEIINIYKEPALVENYINTRELNVTVVGSGQNAQVLPISEIVFGKSYDNKKKWKIVDFAAKWLEESENYQETIGICPAEITDKIKKKIERYVLKAYSFCGNPGYARIDIRLSEDEKIYFLEINLNPDISDDMGASRSAKAFGWTYPQFLKKIIEVSLERFTS